MEFIFPLYLEVHLELLHLIKKTLRKKNSTASQNCALFCPAFRPHCGSMLGFFSSFQSNRTDALWRSKCVSLQIFEIELNRWLGKEHSLIIIIGEFASNKRATPLVWWPPRGPGAGPLCRFSRRVCLLWFEEARESTRYFTSVMNNRQ